MKVNYLLPVLFSWFIFSPAQAQLLEHVESESGTLLAGYTGKITSPFSGIATYGNGDGVEHATTKFSNVPAIFRIDVRGASSANSAAGIAIYVDGKKVGAVSFSNTTPAVKGVEFKLESTEASPKIKFILETDTGANDTFIDWYELHYVGVIPPLPAAPVLPTTGAFYSGTYRNLFAEAGYSQTEITAKLNAAYDQLFHSSNKAQESGEAIFIEMPNDSSMAYIWDTGNNDVRSEGLSYGMMMAVQMNRQDDFNKLWKWATTYALNKSGDMKGYFAWQTSTSGAIRDKNPAPDGEEYFVTALFFASNRWGDGTGVFHYREQANKLLDDMFNNGQTRYNNQGQLENFSLFDHTVKQVVFSPATPADRNWTDPSYHLPAFYELWALWADRNNSFWADLAVSSRAFLKTTVHPVTGLNPDYAYFDGRPHGEFQNWKDTFQYDAWRTISNASIDYAWFKKDEWAVTYAERLQTFFTSKGVETYGALFELNGDPYENNRDHSPGLVAMNAVGSLASRKVETWPFVQNLWNNNIPSGRYRYYDGSLHMFGLLAASGNYRIYCPNDACIRASSSSSISSTRPSSSSVRSVASSAAPSSLPATSLRSSIASSVASSVRSSIANSVRSSVESSVKSSIESSVRSSTIASSQPSSKSSSASSVAVVTLGRVEAESFSTQAGVQTESTSDVGGGVNVGYIQNGDFVEYQINVPTTGTYQVQFRVASNTSGGTINILARNANVGSVMVANTGGWQAWTSVTKTIQLSEGPQTLRLNFTGGGDYLLNLNWFQFVNAGSSSSAASSVRSSAMNSISRSSSSVSSIAGGVVCTHVILNEWNQGFGASVRVTNKTTAPVTGWSVTWRYTDGSRITNSWNATVTGGNPYSATPLSWLRTINPGQTVEIGVQGTKGIANGPAPTAVVTCS